MTTDTPYKEALNRILKAKKENSSELDLSRLKLAKLPLEIGQLTQLQYLSLKTNSLSELPPEIVQLTQLQTLDLANNSLSKLPLEITNSLN